MSAESEGARGEQPDTRAEKPRMGPGVTGILTTTQDRVAEILAATESAAADIVEAANAESAQIARDTHAKAERLAQSRIGQIDSVTNAVLNKAGALESELDALRELVAKSTERLAEELGLNKRAPEPRGAAKAPTPTEKEPATERTANGDGKGQSANKGGGGLLGRMRASHKRDTSEGVKVLAAQMMAAGASKDEVRTRLSEEFGVDPAIALNAIDNVAAG